MIQLILNISDPSILPDLRKAIEAIDGVTILEKEESAKCGLDEALEDVREGRVYSAESVDDLFR